MAQRNCEECGKSYSVKIADISRGWGRACSKKCAAKLREKLNKVMRIVIGPPVRKKRSW